MPEQEKPQTDLSSPDNVAKGQEVYEQITRGEVQDVAAALSETYGREG